MFNLRTAHAPRILAAALLIFHPAAGGEPMGRVAELSGRASVFRAGKFEYERLAIGAELSRRDIVHTRAGSRLRIDLDDGTTIGLGEEATLWITRHAYTPQRAALDSVLTITRGFFRMVTGALDLDRRARVRTVTATLGIRGTELLGESTEALTQVFAADGTVGVRGRGIHAASEVLLAPGEGTSVAAGAAPRPRKRWPGEKVESFRAAVRLPR